jgi:hypothetical protein
MVEPRVVRSSSLGHARGYRGGGFRSSSMSFIRAASGDSGS